MGWIIRGRAWRLLLAIAVLAATLFVLPGAVPSAGAAGTDYRDLVLSHNPVAYWRLGDSVGNVASDQVSAVDGTYEGSPLLAEAGLVADADSAVRFGGGNDLVHVPDSSLINLATITQRTIEAWFQVDSTGPRQVIVEEGGGTRGLNIYVESGQVYFGGWNTQNDASADTPWGGTFFSAAITAGAIHHVVLVLDQPTGTLTGYLDGIAVGSGPAGTLHSHASDTGIGAMNDASRFHDSKRGGDSYHFVGVIDEVAFYNSVLTGADVAAHYATGVATAEDPSVSFVAPADGAVVSGLTTIEVAASDPQDSASALLVDISTDGGSTFSPATFNPGSGTHSIGWDTTGVADGPVTLVARVEDTAGNSTTTAISVAVLNNPGQDDYVDVVLADSPVVYYRLGEVGGTTATDEVGNVDSDYAGGPALGMQGLVPGPDLAVGFDGINDLVAVPDSDLINKGQFPERSVEAWFNVTGTSSRQVIFEEGAGTRGLSLYIEGGQIHGGAWNLSGQSWGPVFLNSPITPNETHHAVVVLGSGSLTLYVDGVSVGTAGGAGTLFNHNADAGIGAMNDSGRFHDGKVGGNGYHLAGVLDEIAIYNSILDASAVAAHYAAGTSAGPQDPSVSFFVPAPGAVVDGTVVVELTVSDPQDDPASLTVEVSTDGAGFFPASFNAASGRFEWGWDTSAEADGPVTLTGRVTDLDANSATDTVDVTVDNAAANDPTVSFFVPTEAATVAGTVTIEVVASDPQDSADLLAVDISVDGGATFASATYNAATGRHELLWDTSAGADGSVLLVANVVDTDTNTGSSSISVTVDNAAADRPVVAFHSPADTDTVSGLVLIQVVATDPQTTADLLTVEISADGGATYSPALYQPATQRHTLDWDTGAIADGQVTLVARVTDPESNMAMDSIVVTVDNASVNAPNVAFIDPGDSDVVSGTVTVEVTATDPQSAPDLLTVEISTDGGATFAPASFNAGPQTHAISWDTTSAPDGDTTLVARVTDPDAFTDSTDITVTVANVSPTAYRDAVLASGPSVYWRLDETAGTTALDIVGGLHSSYVGGPLLGQTGLVADANTAVDFDGVNDYIAVPDSSLINIGTRTRRTISAWFKADDATSRQVIVDEGGVTRGLSIYVYQGNVYVGAWNTPNDPSADTPWGPTFFSAPVDTGQVYNAVAVLDQPTGTFTAYVNGVAIGSATGGTLHGHGSDTGIGAMNNATRFHDMSSTGNGYYFNGIIDEVAFYNAALSAGTVDSLYLTGKAQANLPRATFFNPKNGNAVSGSITIEITATDPQDPESALSVEISTDGGATFAPATFNPGTLRHTLPWDTTASPDGTNTLVARVTDTDLNTTSKAINVTVSNTGATHMIIAAGDISHCNNTNDTDTANLISQIIATTSLPVTVVPVGDLVYEDGTDAEFADCYDPTWGQHKAITMPVVGNHEYNTPGAAGYFNYFGAVAAPPDGWYRYELAGWEIYALNSNCGSIGTCGPTTPQIQWFRSELAASSNACTLAFHHHPRFTEQTPFSNQEEFWKAMYDFGGDLIVSAHAHYYAHSALQDWQGNADPVNGIRQIIAGTGGRSLHSFPSNPHPNQQVVDNTSYGVVVIELSADSYDWSFRRVGDGAILYSGSDTCH